MSPPRFVLTQHALERMRDRVLPGATLDECRIELERRFPQAHWVPRPYGRGRLYYLAGTPPACCIVIEEKGTMVVVTVAGWEDGRGLVAETEAKGLGYRPVPDDLRLRCDRLQATVNRQTELIEELTREKIKLKTTADRAIASRDAQAKRAQMVDALRGLLLKIVAGGYLAGAPQRLRDRAAHYAKHDPEVPAPGEG